MNLFDNTNLENELLERLECFEMISKEDDSIHFSEFTGEEFSMSSMRKNLQLSGLERFEKDLKNWKRNGKIQMFLDDGWLHLTFKKELLSKSFINKLQFDD